jgi:oxygen-independent coproporphyrinogen-3 oxidase
VKPLAVYVHIPFCTVKCGYCDFNTYAGMDALKPSYRDAVVAEAAAWSQTLGERLTTSIAFGGGTPGEVAAGDIAAIIDAVGRAWPLAADAEVSLEANPGTSDPAHFARLRAAGVTRLSLGAQSFDAAELRFLDRIHSPQAIAASYRAARDAGFASISLDLIYGLPGQEPNAWQANVREALALAPDHLSLYALTVEPGTPLAIHVESGQVAPPDPDVAADMYEWSVAELARSGFEHYEISNWARPGHRSMHNQVYWTDRDYLGLGAGAHGYIDGMRFENIAHPRRYIARERALTGDGRAIAAMYRPDDVMARSDWLTSRLRLLDGFEAAEFAARFGTTIEAAVGEPLQAAAEAGLMDLSPRVRLTERGCLLHGEIAARFLAHLERTAVAPRR